MCGRQQGKSFFNPWWDFLAEFAGSGELRANVLWMMWKKSSKWHFSKKMCATNYHE